MRVNSSSTNAEPPREPIASLAHDPLHQQRPTPISLEADRGQNRDNQDLAQGTYAPASGWTHGSATLSDDKVGMIYAEIAGMAHGEQNRPVGSFWDAIVAFLNNASETPPIVTGLGTDVDAVINQSPTLVEDLNDLIDQGYTIEVGPAGGGTYVNRNEQRIVIEEGRMPEATALSVAHEVGHGINLPTRYSEADHGRNDFVELNTRESLRNEALATLYALDVRAEILAAGGPDIGSSGAQSAQYIAIYDALPAGQGKVYDAARLAAVEDIADLFAFGERPSTDPSITYDEYYREAWADIYDA